MKSKIVVSLSGGMDSVTLLCYYLDQGYDVYPMIFTYGSKHNMFENMAARNICNKFSLDYKFINLEYMNTLFKSNLLKSGGDIPEGHYEEESMSKTVVPGRNIIFIANMAGYAWSVGAKEIAIGVHTGDHAIYADCRKEFIDAMNNAVYLGTDKNIIIQTPFQYLDKAGILNIGYNLKNIKVPYELTRTCYKGQEISCGKCGSCTERLEAFHIIGRKDPINYEE